MADSSLVRAAESFSARELEILKELAARATDREIAQKLHLSLNTIKWHNRQIYSKLGVSNRKQAVAVAEQHGLFDAAKPQATAEAAPLSNLPPLDRATFVGRKQEMSDLSELLASHRLVTLTGPGGVGKSRLALHASAPLLAEFKEGVFLVELTRVRDPDLVATVIADALNVPDRPDMPLSETLSRHLNRRRDLLLLDGFEHLMAARRTVKELHEAAHAVTLLVTSRERLNLYGEQVYPVEPVGRADSVALFYTRARALGPTFDPDGTDKSTVEEICRQLDHLPLAIELAAGRVPLLPPEAILERLVPHLDGLKASEHDRPDRHQTLRATIDWSYRLLDEDERKLFSSLGMFIAGATLDALEAICAPDLSTDLFGLLEALINKSLIWQQTGVGGEPRFGMLDTIRVFAEEHMEGGAHIWNRFADFYQSLTKNTSEKLRGPGETARSFQDKIDQEMPNIRAAFDWLFGNESPVKAMELLIHLRLYWWATNPSQGIRWADKAFERGRDAPEVTKATVETVAGEMEYLSGDLERAGELGAAALEVLRDSGEARFEADVLRLLGSVNTQQGDYDRGETTLKEALALYEQLGDRFDVAYVLNSLGELMRMQGKYESAKELYEESLRVSGWRSTWMGSAAVLKNLASVARHLGDQASAIDCSHEALKVSWDRQIVPMICGSLDELAGLSLEMEPSRSVRWMGAAHAAREELGLQIEPVDRTLCDQDLESLREILGDEAFNSARKQGRMMDLEEVVREALEAVIESSEGGSSP
jgi:predicted ATPase/DNA-binding CsgD family transcriptional regulator